MDDCLLPPSAGQTLLRLVVHNHVGGASLALLVHHFNLWDKQAHLVIRYLPASSTSYLLHTEQLCLPVFRDETCVPA